MMSNPRLRPIMAYHHQTIKHRIPGAPKKNNQTQDSRDSQAQHAQHAHHAGTAGKTLKLCYLRSKFGSRIFVSLRTVLIYIYIGSSISPSPYLVAAPRDFFKSKYEFTNKSKFRNKYVLIYGNFVPSVVGSG